MARAKRTRKTARRRRHAAEGRGAALWPPSLVKRLMGAQLLITVLLWLILIAFRLYRSRRDESELAAGARFQREADGIKDEPLMRIRRRVRQRGSPASDIEVAFVKPGEAINVLFAFTLHGFRLLPLAIGLTFLALPFLAVAAGHAAAVAPAESGTRRAVRTRSRR